MLYVMLLNPPLMKRTKALSFLIVKYLLYSRGYQDLMILSLKIIFLSGIRFDKKIIFFLVLPLLLAVSYRSICRFAICGASAWIICVPALLGGVYGGGRLSSQDGKGKNFLL